MFTYRVKELRLQRGWTQAQLSEKSGNKISQMTISNVESRHTNKSITLHTLEIIIDAFNSDDEEIPVCMHDVLRYKCRLYEKCTLEGKKYSNCYGDCKCNKIK